MPMTVVHIEGQEASVDAAVRWLTAEILQALRDSEGQVCFGVSGGSTPLPVYARLSTERSIDWSRILVFLVDERYVPADAPDSNQRAIWETLLTHEASQARFIVPNTSLPLAACAQSYDEQLLDLSPDVVLLGMGTDGHIASLFPPLPPEAFGPKRVICTTTDRFAVRDRISVTLPLLLRASRRLVLTTGEEKMSLLQTMQHSPDDYHQYPAQYLFDERTTWMTSK